jgi:hypothetical protein
MINMSDYYYGEYNQEEREEEYQAYIKYQNWKAEHGEEYGIY